jgi:toxin CcdB
VAQFDVYKNNNENRDLFPYLLDITHEINTVSQLRVVVPLCSDRNSVTHLNPIFEIKGERLYMSTMDIAGIPVSILGEVVDNLSEQHTQIIDALDFLVNGF